MYIRTAIFPVRYKDFDDNIVENAVRPSLGSIVMLITCSLGREPSPGSQGFYDVDRFAGRKRGPKKYDPTDSTDPRTPEPHFAIDNNRVVKTELTEPANMAPGAQYLESSLPYKLVITDDRTTRRLPAPQTGPTFPNLIPFVVNQRYWILNSRAENQPYPTGADDPDGYIAPTSVGVAPPRPGEPAFEGSGGNYLSNEIFYRTALLRSNLRPTLSSGHFHLPWPGDDSNDPQNTGPGLLNAVQTAAEKFLKSVFRMTGSGNINFPRTPVTRTSQPIPLTATNITNQPIKVGAVEVTPPFAVQLPGALPIAVNAGASLVLPLTFTPTTEITYNGTVTLRDEGGELLLTARLTGEGAPPVAAPRVASFSPTSAREGITVTISGENFDGVTDVRIGSGSVPFTVTSAVRITALVTDEATTGPIAVDTPSGTATSAATFRVIIRPPREEL